MRRDGQEDHLGVLYWLFIFPVLMRMGMMVAAFPMLIHRAATGTPPADGTFLWYVSIALGVFGLVGGAVATWKGHKALMRFLSDDPEPAAAAPASDDAPPSSSGDAAPGS